MGTSLGVLFIAGAAAAGIFVGTRPTVIDGRLIAAELEKGEGRGVTFWCDREIRLGAGGAEFACTQSRLGARQRIRYRMTRDGQVHSVEMLRGERAPAERDD
jgi:hypothetical protein